MHGDPVSAGVARVLLRAARSTREQVMGRDEFSLPLHAAALDGEFEGAPLDEASRVSDVAKAAVGERRHEESAVRFDREEVLAREAGEGLADHGGGCCIAFGQLSGGDAAAGRPHPAEDVARMASITCPRLRVRSVAMGSILVDVVGSSSIDPGIYDSINNILSAHDEGRARDIRSDQRDRVRLAAIPGHRGHDRPCARDPWPHRNLPVGQCGVSVEPCPPAPRARLPRRAGERRRPYRPRCGECGWPRPRPHPGRRRRLPDPVEHTAAPRRGGRVRVHRTGRASSSRSTWASKPRASPPPVTRPTASAT